MSNLPTLEFYNRLETRQKNEEAMKMQMKIQTKPSMKLREPKQTLPLLPAAVLVISFAAFLTLFYWLGLGAGWWR